MRLNRWRRVRVVVSGAVASSLLALGSADARGGASTSAPSPEDVLHRFVQALNRHDVEAQYAHYTDDMVYVNEGRRIRPPREEERRDRAFEMASGAAWSYEVLEKAEGRIDALLTEDMEFYRALGVGPRSSRRQIMFRGGLIREMSASDWTQAGRPYEGARDLFLAWLRRERPQVAARVSDARGLLFDGTTAPLLNPLAREWRAAHPCRLYHPSFHPHAPRIAFSSDCDGKWNVYVMEADGSHPRRLTDNTADSRRPAWWPDGRGLVFHSDRDGNWEVYEVGADGSGLSRLTHHPAADRNPLVSPDGAHILFSSDRSGAEELHLMGKDGSAVRQLTSGTTLSYTPAWSPDGALILHPASRAAGAKDGDPLDLFLLRPDGSPLGRLPGGPRRDFNHVFSPDGRDIVFDAHARGGWESEDGLWELWRMSADGSGRRRLTSNAVNDWGPAFSPDGRTIAFLSGRENVYDIYTMNADGTGRRRLTRWTANPD
jgi:TolB protein